MNYENAYRVNPYQFNHHKTARKDKFIREFGLSSSTDHRTVDDKKHCKLFAGIDCKFVDTNEKRY